MLTSVALSSSLKSSSTLLPKTTNNQQEIPKVSESTASPLLIGPFKNNLEICLFLVQHPDIINLALSMMKASGQQDLTTQITQGKSDKCNVLSEKVNY